MRNQLLGGRGTRRRAAVVAAVGLLAVSAQISFAADAQPRIPSFLDSRHLPTLPGASGAVADASADAAVLRSADEASRRAEEERLKAIEIRRQAEALSQRFAAELPATEQAAPDKMDTTAAATAMTAPVPAPAPVPAAAPEPVTTGSLGHSAARPAVSEPALVRARQAEAELQEAREALARARVELEEATRRAREAATPRMLAEPAKPAQAKPHPTRHAKAPPAAKQPAPAKAATEPARRLAETPPASRGEAAEPAPTSTAIKGPTMGRQPHEPVAATAAAGGNPITGLLSKVFGGNDNTPPAPAFND